MTHWKILSLVLLLSVTSACEHSVEKTIPTDKGQEETTKQLRHIVLFQFNNSATTQEIESVEKAFANLPSQIAEITAFEWGTNNSPENLNKNFTHSFLVTFTAEKERDIYLTHPAHLAFVEILTPHLKDVLVLDYWTN